MNKSIKNKKIFFYFQKSYNHRARISNRKFTNYVTQQEARARERERKSKKTNFIPIVKLTSLALSLFLRRLFILYKLKMEIINNKEHKY